MIRLISAFGMRWLLNFRVGQRPLFIPSRIGVAADQPSLTMVEKERMQEGQYLNSTVPPHV